MNTDDIKNKIAQFAKSQLPFLVKLYDLVQVKFLKKEKEEDDSEGFSSNADETSEFDIDGAFDKSEVIEQDGEQRIQIKENKKIEVEDNQSLDEIENNENNEDDEDDEDDEDEEDEDEEQAKKEKRSKIIRVIAIVGILYFAIDEFVLTQNKSGESLETAQTSQTSQKRKKTQDDQIDEMTKKGTLEAEREIQQKKEAAKQALKAQTQEEFTIDDLSDGSDNNELMDLENQQDIMVDKERKRDDDDGLETTEFDKSGYEDLKTPDKKVGDEEILFKEDDYEDITPVELKEEIEESQTQEEIQNSPQDEEIEGVSINILKELEEKLKQKELTRDQDLVGEKKDLSLQGRKVPLVDYYREGRGLVYNCQAEHWACVDELSYLQCREGFQINNLRDAASTCLPFNVYKTVKDCKRAQYEAMGSAEEKKCRQ